MDAGLSLRMHKALQELVPAFAAAAPPKQYNPATAVDLSSAQNEVLRAELLELFKTTVEDKVTSEVNSGPSAPVSSSARLTSSRPFSCPSSRYTVEMSGFAKPWPLSPTTPSILYIS